VEAFQTLASLGAVATAPDFVFKTRWFADVSDTNSALIWDAPPDVTSVLRSTVGAIDPPAVAGHLEALQTLVSLGADVTARAVHPRHSNPKP